MHQSANDYEASFKALGLERATARALIAEERPLGTVVNVSRRPQPSNIPPRARWRLVQEVTKGNPEGTANLNDIIPMSRKGKKSRMRRRAARRKKTVAYKEKKNTYQTTIARWW